MLDIHKNNNKIDLANMFLKYHNGPFLYSWPLYCLSTVLEKIDNKCGLFKHLFHSPPNHNCVVDSSVEEHRCC